MNAHDQICTQRALNTARKEFATGPEYKRSSLLTSLDQDLSYRDLPTWFLPSKVNSGYLDFTPEDGVIKVGRNQGNLFQAYTLMKVNNETDGDIKFKVDSSFFPLLHRMIREKRDWGSDVRVTGCATFQVGVLEWTENTLRVYAHVLRQAGIYGAVAVSRYPYEYSSNVWKAFCELWGPLTNTFHQGNGEMSVSLYDLKIIGGLPILGIPYEEFIPPNQDLCKKGAYPSTLPELLRVHSQMCKFYGQRQIFWDQWLAHFYREKIIYVAYGEGNQQMFPNEKKMSKAQEIPMEISKEGALAAFLVFWLSRFVLPSAGGRVRPETFPMACLMAQGSKVSLAPTVLGYIYHGLGEVVAYPRGPKSTCVSIPIHYIVGWLGEHFPYLYRSRPDGDFPNGYPKLARYAGVEPKEVSISHARFIFQSDRSVFHRPTALVEEKGYSLMDNEDLSDDHFEFLVCICTAKLPVRVGENLWIEPYYPNRFARQFSFDQGVPANKLKFGVSSRQQCGIEDLFEAQAVLLRRNTGSLFYVPRSTHRGTCTYWYCRWWMTSCATYLGTSLTNIYTTFNKRPFDNKRPVFVVSVLRDISTGLRKEVLLSEVEKEKSFPSLRQVGESSGLPKGKKAVTDKKCKTAPGPSSSGSSSEISHDVNFKRARYEKPDNSGNTDIVETVVVVAADNFIPEATSENLSAPFSHTKVMNQSYGKKLVAPVSNEIAPSSLQEVQTSIHTLFGPEVNNLRQGYIIGEVENILVKLSSSNSHAEILDHREEVNMVLDVLRPIINILESGKAELEWFVRTVRRVFEFASQISDSADIIEQGNQIRDLIRQHNECLSTKKNLESEMSDSIQELKKVDAEELSVKEAEEVARVLREQYDATRLSDKRRVSDLSASVEQQTKLDAELRRSRIDAKEELLPDIDRAEALNKSAEEGILNSIASLLHFCSKPE